MLVLSRKLNQEFRVGHKVIIKIIGIKGNQVRVGIIAPDDVDVLREELYQKQMQEVVIELSEEEAARELCQAG